MNSYFKFSGIFWRGNFNEINEEIVTMLGHGSSVF